MSPISIKALAALAAFIGATNAHMMMGHPLPMGKATLNNSPLAADGSDFPCKLRGEATWDESTGINELTPGVANDLDFIGSAVHGGGSCQVSLSTDLRPTKDSKWMVIKSIEGGCPSGVSGNLAANPDGTGASSFKYTVPLDMPAGDYTIAWTWQNKIGNREMYMNCGRAKILAAPKKRYAPTPKTSVFKRDNYPDMFVANIGNGCSVAEGTDVKYPNGGPDVETGNGNLQPPTGNCGGSGGSSPPQPSSGSSSPEPSTGGNEGGNSSTPTSTAGGSSQPSVSGGVFATVTPSGAAPQPTTSAPSQPEASQPPTQASSAPSSQGTSSGSVTGTQSGPCSDEGAWSCAPDGKSFQRCASGQWSAPMQMSTGMSCTPGVSNTFAMNAAGKRDLRGHIARRRHANIIS